MNSTNDLDWRDAAMKIGESIGQLTKTEYYYIGHLTPEQWVNWANAAISYFKKKQQFLLTRKINNENY